MSTSHVVFIHGRDRTPKRPPAPDELAGVYRLRRMIEPGLAADSCQHIRPEELDKLEMHIPSFTHRTGNAFLAHRAFYINLLRPATTHWDLLVLRPLWDRTDAVGERLRQRFPHDMARFALISHHLVDAYRTRDPEIVRAASLHHLEESERVARRLLRAVS